MKLALEKGKLPATIEITDRTEGKAPQTVAVERSDKLDNLSSPIRSMFSQPPVKSLTGLMRLLASLPIDLSLPTWPEERGRSSLATL